MIKTHKEGNKIIIFLSSFLAIAIISISFFYGFKSMAFIFSLVSSLLLLSFVLRFFRVPELVEKHDSDILYAPAYGKVVAMEETMEPEYFNEKKLQISIFMSVWDVHINWFSMPGVVKYFKYHPGKYLLARHPKSSTLNERTTVVIESSDGVEVLFRQIAGAVARRVICYAKVQKNVLSSDEMGFIKFGSRVDIFLPVETAVMVSIGDKVKGNISPIAMLKNV
jgi:phosphatidylserine decarboxylase